MKCSPPPDETIDPAWQAEQQNRLLGFEVLQHILKGHPAGLSPTAIRERTGGTRLGPDEVYRKKFIPKLLKKLGATNYDEALSKVRQLRDVIH